MSQAGTATQPRGTLTADQYDHEINLVDTTSPTTDDSELSNPESSSADVESAGLRTEDVASKRRIKSGLKEELARRKYARFQEDRYAEDEESTASTKDGDPAKSSSGKAGTKVPGSKRGRVKERLALKLKKAKKKRAKDQEFEVDVLYENQRGWFFCGIPLYSSKSLLNFDPSPWTTFDFKDSPVNITNAQVPDPTWAWAWKSWYVDMSHDVDEEGWEYSFSFRQGFSWHGTHPWFHSYVRRRRWLRKRVKIQSALKRSAADSITEAHRLNQDYFTIHSARRERSRGSSAERSTTTRSGFLNSGKRFDSDSDSDDEEITNIAALIKSMKRTTIDRKKLEAIKNFVENGGDELYYLPDIVSELMSLFMYQSSKRRLLEILEGALEGAGEKESGQGSTSTEVDSPKNQGPNGLRRAAEAIRDSIKDFEYWSDIRKTTREGNGVESPISAEEASQTRSSQSPDSQTKLLDVNEMVSRIQIKGIPAAAELDVEPGIMRPLGFTHDKSEGASPKE